MGQVAPEIVKYVQTLEATDLAEVTQLVRKKFGVLINIQTVGQLLKNRERLGVINEARDQAANRVSDKVTLQERAIEALSELAFDMNGLEIKDRLLVMKELRQWVGQSIEVSGLFDEKTNALFKFEWQQGADPE
jgi:hypothetical protein